MLPTPGPTRHVVLLCMHGVDAADLDLYPEYDGPKVEVPNLRAAARLGLRVVRCTGVPEGVPEAGLRRLIGLDGDDGPSLLARAERAGWLVLSWLPTRESAWLAEVASAGPRWDVVVPDLSAREPFSWPELLSAAPRVRVRGDEDAAGVASHFEDRILARFPGRATMQRYDWEGKSPRVAAQHWCAWVGDSFLRALWFALSRAERGTLCLVSHPGPLSLKASFGDEGYRYAVEEVDALVGRLLLLREHEALRDLLLLAVGDVGCRVPAVVLGPGIPEAQLVPAAGLDDLRRLVAAAL